MFLGGFMSDMTGTKAVALEDFCRKRGQAFLRFDYQGHGQSSGRFEDGCIGTWSEDAIAALDALTEGPQILVGSSMGGWIMLLAALARPQRVKALIGIAPAPDATEDLMWAGLSPEQQEAMQREGSITLPSDYDPAGYSYSWRLIEDGRKHLVMRQPIALICPARLLHGMKDDAVPWQTSLALSEKLGGDDVAVTLIKDGDHRLSRPEDLERLKAAVVELS